MKIHRFAIFSFLGILFTLTLACGFNVSTAKVTEAYTARVVNGSPQATTAFSQNDVFNLLVTLSNAPDDTVTKAVWYAADAEGLQKDYKIDEAEFTSGDQQVTFDLSNDQPWPVGKYKVELFLNDKLNQTLEFSVEASPAVEANGAGAFDAYMVSDAGGNTVATDTYMPDETFYLVVDLSHMPANALSKAIWYAVNATGITPNSQIEVSEYTGNGEITFNLSNNNPWPAGTYAVEIYVNNVFERTVQFNVADGAAPASGTTSSSGNVEITSAYTARDINGKLEPVEVYASDEVFHCYLELSQVSPDTKFKAEWKAISAEGWDANTSLDMSEGYSQSDAMVFDLSNSNPWGKGKYSVDVYMNDVLQGTLEFAVE